MLIGVISKKKHLQSQLKKLPSYYIQTFNQCGNEKKKKKEQL